MVPLVAYARFLGAEGGGMGALFAAWGANGATRGLAWDLALAGLAFALWVIAETRARENWGALVVLPVGLGLGLGCALPLYLFLRTRPIA